jgi:hypothetical protein
MSTGSYRRFGKLLPNDHSQAIHEEKPRLKIWPLSLRGLLYRNYGESALPRNVGCLTSWHVVTSQKIHVSIPLWAPQISSYICVTGHKEKTKTAWQWEAKFNPGGGGVWTCALGCLYLRTQILLLLLLTKYTYAQNKHVTVMNSTTIVHLQNTRWFKYDRDYLCANKSQFVPVIFQPPCRYVTVIDSTTKVLTKNTRDCNGHNNKRRLTKYIRD